MFGKERRQKREQELNESRLKKEREFSAAIEAADKLEDPADKIFQLRAISNNISEYLLNQNTSINRKATSAGNKAWFGTWGAGTATALTGLLLLTGPVGLGITLGGSAVALVAPYVDGKRKKHVAKKMMEAATSHKDKVIATKAYAEATIAETVENKVDVISASPLRKELLALPGLSDLFSEAAAKHIAEAKKEEPAVEEKKEPVLTKRKNKAEPKQ